MGNYDLKVVLEVEKQNPSDEKGMFYRYAIGDFKLWFSQADNGNIYSVGFVENGDALKDFDLYIRTNECARGGYYPNEFEIRPKSYGMTTADAWEFMQNMKKACRILDAVEEFFATSKHRALYDMHHPQGEKSIEVKAFVPNGDGKAVFAQVYPLQSQDEALKLFREEHPEYKGCILVAEFVYGQDAEAEKKEDELISRQALLSEIKAYLGSDWTVWDEDCKRAWFAITDYSSPDVDLIPRGELLNAVLAQFGCDLAYFGAPLQFFQDAIVGVPAVSAGKVDAVIAEAEKKSARGMGVAKVEEQERIL